MHYCQPNVAVILPTERKKENVIFLINLSLTFILGFLFFLKKGASLAVTLKFGKLFSADKQICWQLYKTEVCHKRQCHDVKNSEKREISERTFGVFYGWPPHHKQTTTTEIPIQDKWSDLKIYLGPPHL